MFKSRLFTVGILIVIVFLGLSLIRLRQPIGGLNAEIEYVDQKLAEVQQKNEDLTSNVNSSNNESYIERQLRLKLNYKKADEEAVLIYKTQATVQQPDNSGFLLKEYDRFLNWLKNLL